MTHDEDLAHALSTEPGLQFVHVYWTHREIFGEEMLESDLVARLGQIAVGDCVGALSRLSCLVEGHAVIDDVNQVRIMRRLGLNSEVVSELEALLSREDVEAPRAFFFPQQIVHLMRLALLHCDRREPDDFRGGELIGSFLKVLFGVTDVFEPELIDDRAADAIGFILRQDGIMTRPDDLYLFSRYYELLVQLWPRVHDAEGDAFVPAAEFQRATGVTLEDFFTVGFALFAHFLSYINNPDEPETFRIDPATYFANAKLPVPTCQAVVDLLVDTPDGLRGRLCEEEEKYGPTTYRSHTFDRVPLVRFEDGSVAPTSFVALERSITEGPFWTLAETAEAQGRKREDFTSPFGDVFERFAQESLERMADHESKSPRTYRDFEYGPRRARTLSSDMTFVYDREAIFFEVVTGRLSVATQTRGDVRAFEYDAQRIVLKKAAQLRRCYQDFFLYGTLKFDGVGHGRIHTVWPVLICLEDFPLMPPLISEIERRIRRDGWPKNAPRISILDADSLGAFEVLMERGWSALDVLRAWKREGADLPFSNWLSVRKDIHGEPLGHAVWHAERFSDLTAVVASRMFGPAAGQRVRELDPSSRGDA